MLLAKASLDASSFPKLGFNTNRAFVQRIPQLAFWSLVKVMYASEFNVRALFTDDCGALRNL